MLNFLPPKNRKQIIYEYILRTLSFLLLFIFAVCLILISLFFPTFFFVKYKNDTVSNQLLAVQQINANKSNDPTVFIKNVNRLSVALSNNSGSDITNSDIINKIVSLKNKEIKIISINLTIDKSTSDRTVSLDGIANTRDSLTLFSNNLKTDGFFNTVAFPVSNFIKSTDSEFSATLIYKNK